MNIELSNDYDGGGIFYIKPLVSTGEIDSKYDDMGYEWIDTIKRENTTEIIFPDLHAGDAIFYNYTGKIILCLFHVFITCDFLQSRTIKMISYNLVQNS